MAREYPGSIVWEKAIKEFAHPTTLRERRVEVGVTLSRILDNNPRRLFWRIVNRTLYDGAIGFDTDLVFGNGLYIPANGGSVSMTVIEDGETVGYPIYGLLGAGSGIWWVMEVIGL